MQLGGNIFGWIYNYQLKITIKEKLKIEKLLFYIRAGDG